MRVKYLKVSEGEKLGVKDKGFSYFDIKCSVKHMKEVYFGKDALLVRCGRNIYNVTGSPDIYYKHAH